MYTSTDKTNSYDDIIAPNSLDEFVGYQRGNLKKEMFSFYNSMVGKSRFFPKAGEP